MENFGQCDIEIGQKNGFGRSFRTEDTFEQQLCRLTPTS
jgi:hypothetical protein